MASNIEIQIMSQIINLEKEIKVQEKFVSENKKNPSLRESCITIVVQKECNKKFIKILKELLTNS